MVVVASADSTLMTASYFWASSSVPTMVTQKIIVCSLAWQLRRKLLPSNITIAPLHSTGAIGTDICIGIIKESSPPSSMITFPTWTLMILKYTLLYVFLHNTSYPNFCASLIRECAWELEMCCNQLYSSIPIGRYRKRAPACWTNDWRRHLVVAINADEMTCKALVNAAYGYDQAYWALVDCFNSLLQFLIIT